MDVGRVGVSQSQDGVHPGCPQRQAPQWILHLCFICSHLCRDTGGRHKDNPLYRQEMEAKVQGHLLRDGREKGW